MVSDTYKINPNNLDPNHLSDEEIEMYRADIAACSNPYTDEDVKILNLTVI